MKQLSFLENQSTKKKGHRWKLFVDGASRHNPGPSGAGVYLLKEDEPIIKQGFYLGKKTNNQAEYYALLLGIYFAQRHMAEEDTLIIHSDSELLIKQFKGEYGVRNPDLLRLHACIKERLQHIYYSLRHVMREYNAIADQLANHGIDKKLPLPFDIQSLCPQTED